MGLYLVQKHAAFINNMDFRAGKSTRALRTGKISALKEGDWI